MAINDQIWLRTLWTFLITKLSSTVPWFGEQIGFSRNKTFKFFNVILPLIFFTAMPFTALYAKSFIWSCNRIISSTIQSSMFLCILLITYSLQIFYRSRNISLLVLLYTFLNSMLRFYVSLIIRTFHIRDDTHRLYHASFKKDFSML